MPAPLARALLLLLATATLAVAGWMFWTQSGVYPVTHPALYACSLAPAVVAVVSLVAMFAPFDSPAGAPRWGAVLAGLAIGLTAGGLVMYTATFVWFGPVLGIYAALVNAAAMAVARGARPRSAAAPPSPPAPPAAPVDLADAPTRAELEPAPEPAKKSRKTKRLKPDGSISDTTTALPAEPPTQAAPAPTPAPARAVPTLGRNVLLVLSALWGIGLCWAWRPPAGAARPLPPGDVATIVSRGSPNLRDLKRVVRRDDHIDITGVNVNVKLSLERPRLEVRLKQQRFVLEPTLAIEEGTVDGFFSIPQVNGYRAEAWGPGQVESLAESGRRADLYLPKTHLGYTRVRYGDLRVTHPGSLAPALGGWGRPPADALTARVDVGVDLDQGIVIVDAITEVPRPLTVRRTVLGALRVLDAKGAKLRVDVGGPLLLTPPAGRPGTTPQPAELLVSDGKVVRALRSRRRDAGPYDTVNVGSFDDWFTVEGLKDRFLVVMPDWTRQASPAPSRTAGHGLPENALVYWTEGDALHVHTDVAGTRVGPGRLSAELPAGVYRWRLRLMALAPGDDPAERGWAHREVLLDPQRGTSAGSGTPANPRAPGRRP